MTREYHEGYQQGYKDAKEEGKEPTTKNDLGVDCISRAEAIKCLECDFDITGKENMKTVVNYINSAHDKIVNLPRVKQDSKTGHWIRIASGSFIDDYRCDCCNNKPPMKQIAKKGTWGWDFTDFCPNCGAKMVEPQESEDKGC